MTMRPLAPLAAAALLACSGMTAAQSYPAKPIRMVTVEVGGGADFVARLIAQGLSAGLGQGALTP
jgi:tripartite-type tricarboxylate transporter receptor subunit TctC